MRKILVEFAMSNTTVRWTLTTVHRALGAKLQSVTIGSMYCLGFTTEDPEGLSEWFCKNHHPTKKSNHQRIIKKSKKSN